MTILRSFHERFFLKWRQLGLKAPPSSTENPFVDEIENVEKIVKERLLSLDLISRELIQLVRTIAQTTMLDFPNIIAGVQSYLHRRGTEIHFHEHEYETSQLDHCRSWPTQTL